MRCVASSLVADLGELAPRFELDCSCHGTEGRRVVVEHRLARLVQLGVRQARYLGRTKTLFQLLMAATVANLTLVAGKVGKMGGIYAGITSGTADRSLAVISTARWSAIPAGQSGSLILTTSVSPP